MNSKEVNFSKPLGLASSNLTEDKNILEYILSSYGDYLGSISIKTANPRKESRKEPTKKRENNRRIVFTDIIPSSILCRGRDEELSIKGVSELSIWLRDKITSLGLDIKIKLSVISVIPSEYVKILNDLKKWNAQFDIIEVPLKYVHKLEKDTSLSLTKLHEITEKEFLRSFQHLIWLRVALKNTGCSDTPISLKLAPENFRPGLLATWLMAPRTAHLKQLHLFNEIKKKILADSASFKAVRDQKIEKEYVAEIADEENGADYVVLFDSEKFPTFLPSPHNPRRSLLIATEAGYPVGGGAIAGKAIAKDSLKYTYETFGSLRRVGKENSYIISSGGCDTGYDLATRLIFGASMVEICTPILRNSPKIISKIMSEFNNYLAHWRINDWHELIGLAHNNLETHEDYNNIDFGTNNVKKCKYCQECLMWCWAANELGRGQRWPTSSCKLCSGCVYLCKQDRFKIERFWE